jgi:hypothetical protein
VFAVLLQFHQALLVAVMCRAAHLQLLEQLLEQHLQPLPLLVGQQYCRELRFFCPCVGCFDLTFVSSLKINLCI